MAWSTKATKVHPGGRCLGGANIPPNVTPLTHTDRGGAGSSEGAPPLGCASASVKKYRHVISLAPNPTVRAQGLCDMQHLQVLRTGLKSATLPGLGLVGFER